MGVSEFYLIIDLYHLMVIVSLTVNLVTFKPLTVVSSNTILPANVSKSSARVISVRKALSYLRRILFPKFRCYRSFRLECWYLQGFDGIRC